MGSCPRQETNRNGGWTKGSIAWVVSSYGGRLSLRKLERYRKRGATQSIRRDVSAFVSWQVQRPSACLRDVSKGRAKHMMRARVRETCAQWPPAAPAEARQGHGPSQRGWPCIFENSLQEKRGLCAHVCLLCRKRGPMQNEGQDARATAGIECSGSLCNHEVKS